MIYTNQATSLARDIAVRSVIGLHESDHVSDVICLLIDHGQQPMKMYIEVTLLYKTKCNYKWQKSSSVQKHCKWILTKKHTSFVSMQTAAIYEKGQ